MKTTVTAFALASTMCLADTQQAVPVWPEGKIPLKTSDAPEKVDPSKTDIVLVTDVNVPTFTVFPAEKKDAPAPAVLVCPGGGYSVLAWDLEGTEIADWLNKQGITAFVLKYRVPNNRDGAFCDVQRAMGLIRSRAAEYNVNPAKIGIMGFSAGAHLSVRTCTNFGKRFYEPVDAADAVSCRPDFALIIYPAYLSSPSYRMTEGLPVTAGTSPTLLIQTQDDAPHVDSSIAYCIALKEAKVPAALHLFPDGGHGYGLRKRNTSADAWPTLAEAWLKRETRQISIPRLSFHPRFGIVHVLLASIAQLVEHLICNHEVIGSTPIAGSMRLRERFPAIYPNPLRLFSAERTPRVLDLFKGITYLNKRHTFS